MLKLTKTGIGLLTKQYRSVLRKCLLINIGLFTITVNVLMHSEAKAAFIVYYKNNAGGNAYENYDEKIIYAYDVGAINSSLSLATSSDLTNYYTKTETDSAISQAISGYATQSWVTGKGYLTSVATGNIANGAVTDAKIASGITANKITQTSSYRFVTDAEKSTWNAKQNALSTAQLNAVNSGITAAKVSTYDGYATTIAGKADKATTLSGYGITNAYTKTETDSAISQAISGFVTNDVQSLNYYYTFRVDERTEVIEFAKELRSNKKEMSSLDFMPIKSSSDLRINLIKAEDPLTFSAKTRDDSLVLMEVCHA